ncbi:hypothetical protein EOI87_03880 [Salmonella enterica]|nr:hypothetical protein [Salmonella enterica]EBQ2127334.1 hypothetical protein [Salmonella enterica]EBT1276676.1 hypothetical protein [Salmonella enterica]EKG9614503.1 hypothetical protein [Salmonella enterica]MIV17089.1 hypothetical protein [Salmonella enterica]
MDIKTSSNDEFNLLAGKIFAHLFEQFPVPSRLYVDMFFDDTHYDRMRRLHEESDSEFPFNIEGVVNHLHDKKLELFIYTVNWLESEGFIRCEMLSPLGVQPEYVDVELTHRAMQFLNIIPRSLAAPAHKKSAIGEILSDAAKQGSRDLLVYGVRVLFQCWRDSF